MIWVAVLACLVISFTFSGIEGGVLSVNRVRLRHHAMLGEDAAVQLDAMLLRIERLVTTVVLLTNAANILAIALVYTEFTRWFGAWGAPLTLVACLPVVTFVLEFLPKAVFRRFPYRTLVVFARVLATAHRVLGPLVAVGVWILRPVFRRTRERRPPRLVETEDVRRAMRLSAAAGAMSETASAFVDRVIDFRSVRPRDLALPFDQVVSVSPQTGVDEILRLAAERDFDRFPVVDASGDIAGVVRVADLVLEGVRSGRAQSYMRRMPEADPDEPALETLRKMRAARVSFAAVKSPGGRPLGIVTSESLVRCMLTGSRGTA